MTPLQVLVSLLSLMAGVLDLPPPLATIQALPFVSVEKVQPELPSPPLPMPAPN